MDSAVPEVLLWKPRLMAGGPCLGQGRFVVILTPEAGLGETAEHCFCCRTEALPCAWISGGQGTNAAAQHVSPCPRHGRQEKSQQEHSPRRGVRHVSWKEGLQEEPGYKLKPCPDRAALSVLSVVVRIMDWWTRMKTLQVINPKQFPSTYHHAVEKTRLGCGLWKVPERAGPYFPPFLFLLLPSFQLGVGK